MATVFIYHFIGYIFPTKQRLKESFTSKVNILSLLWLIPWGQVRWKLCKETHFELSDLEVVLFVKKQQKTMFLTKHASMWKINVNCISLHIFNVATFLLVKWVWVYLCHLICNWLKTKELNMINGDLEIWKHFC